MPVSLAELVGTDDHSREADSLKKEIIESEKGLSEFSIKNFRKAQVIFNQLQDQTKNQPRSKGYKFMAEQAKDLIERNVSKNWDGSFEIMIK